MTKLEPPFALSEGERRHPLWHRLQQHFETQLKNARGKNDDANPEETAILRGQIKTLKALLRLGDEPPIDG